MRVFEANSKRLAVLLSAVILATLAPLAPLASVVPGCAAAGPDHAALVVEHGDGSVVTRCVAFDTATVTGERLLDSSGVAWSGRTFGGYGVAVCALDGEPAHYVDCLGKDNHWAVFVSRGGGSWQLTDVGISSLTLNDGDAEGFRYVPSAGDPSPPPLPAGICEARAALPSAGSSPGSSPGSRAVASASASPSAGPSSLAGSSDPPKSGLDLGLIAAALVGGGLGALALLRLVASLRRAP